MSNLLRTLILAAVAVSLPAVAADQKRNTLAEKVRHELAMLPYYGVFDALNYEVIGNKVILSGAVTRPILASDAVNLVQRIPGVEEVDNQIDVLPLSPYDDRLRLAVYRAVYGWPPLQRLSFVPNPPVRILVKNGVVTLLGIVPTQADKDALNIRANAVFGVFQVDNRLAVERSKTRAS
jgi:hyperosmotically inducible protein